MTEKAGYAIRPHRVNVGGIFIAALKGAMQPLWAVLLVPLFLLAPSFGAALYYHIFSKQNERISSFQKGFLKSLDLKNALLCQLCYLFSFYLVFNTVVSKVQEYFEIYSSKAQEDRVLQLGTPEQLEYAQNVKQVIYIGFAVMFLVMVYIISISMIKCRQKDCCEHITACLKDSFKALTLNIVGYTVFFVLCGFIFSVLEAYFARYKLMYLQGYVLSTDTFDPTLLFLIVRVYLLHIIFYAVSLYAYASVGLKDKIRLAAQGTD